MYSRFGWLKISHHKHTAKLRSHEYTSYLPLFLLLLFVGLALVGCTIATASPGPQSGSVALTGRVPAPPPTTGATISSPSGQQHFASSPITVAGSCPVSTLVEIYKNGVFAGSTPCGSDGKYSIQVDLLNGQDSLIARVYDALNQAGPDSQAITVFYDALPPQAAGLSSLNFSSPQLVLNTDAVYRGVFPGHPLSMPVEILGGTAPYALDVKWGDTTSTVLPRGDNLTFYIQHTYQRAGTYQISLQATDSQNKVAFLTVTAIINGQPAIATVANVTKSPANKLLVLWPLYTGVTAVAVSFWLGERREKRIMAEHETISFTPHPQT